MPGRKFVASGGNYRYGFNGMEGDDEFMGEGNEYDFGARLYDTRTGRWMSTDRENQFASPYLNAANSPIRFKDFDGNWVPEVGPNGQIWIVREEGDNYQSLVDFFGGLENMKKFLPSNYYNAIVKKKDDAIKRLPYLWVDETNNFAKIIKHAYDNPEQYTSAELDQTYHSQTPEAGLIRDEYAKSLLERINYNCHTLAIYGTSGETILTNYEMTVEERNRKIKSEYENVSPDKAKFGQTIITFGYQHDAVYFGKDRSGNTYVLSKNGASVAPQIMKLKDLVTKWRYGSIRNPENNGMLVPDLKKGKGGSGYYNKKGGLSGHIENTKTKD